MDDPARLDSAAALARTPLFSHLDRLERARLAGELEEFHFAPGQAIVTEGDPADGFYVIKSGEVDIVTAEAAGAPVGRLGPGEVFGEMALLTDSRRSASVVTREPVTAWRLSRARFEALLGQERAIAHSIERALSHRLAVATHEAGAYRAAARRLASAMAANLSPAASRLCAAIAARPSWDAAALGRTCAATGTAAALAELQALPGLLRSEGVAVAVDGTLAELLTDGSAAVLPPTEVPK